jgi:hypothetical protein
MRTALRSKLSLLFIVLALMVAIPAIAAYADTFQDSLNGGQTQQTITQNDETGVTVKYWVNAQGTCDLDATHTATFQFGSSPTGVTATPNSLTFDSCGSDTSNFKTVKYTSDTPYGNNQGEGNGYNITWSEASGPSNIGTGNANFSLKVLPDTTAPTVTANTPTGTSEPVGANATATFSEKMDSNTFTNSTFTLVGPSGAVAASRGLSTDGKTATLNPTNDLAPSTTYTATITTGVKDLAGNALAQNTTWTFKTAAPADSTAPTVSSIDRANPDPTNTSTVPWLVTFSENVSGVDVSDFQTANPGGGLTGTGVANVTQVSGSTYTVGANTGSGDGTLRLDAVDDDSIKDAANNTLGGAGNGNGNFVTGQTYTIDKTLPTVTINTPADGATYAQGTTVNASYSCSDSPGTGIKTTGGCVGTKDNGQAIDTSSAGPKSFTVTATDNAGNTRQATSNYTVAAPPNAPTLSLAASSDLGDSDSDKKTKDDTPTFEGTAKAGSTVSVYDGTVAATNLLGTATANATTGAWSFEVPAAKALSQSTHTISATASDVGGTSTAATLSNLLIDKTAPAANCGSASANWSATDATIACAPTDTGGSGLSTATATLTPSSFNLVTSVPAGTETSTASTGSRDIYDVAGNFATAGPIGNNKVDKKAPEVTPADVINTTWRNESLSQSFTSTDGGSGLASGQSLGTNGSFTLTASAQSATTPTEVSKEVKDAVGNTTTRKVSALIDLTDPNISASILNTPASTGWYNLSTGGPQVDFECSDALSGIQSCPDDYTITDEGSNVGYSGTAYDVAGNSKSVSGSGLKVDLTAPAAAGKPDLTTDSGDPTDNLTNVKAPTFDITAETGSAVKLYAKKVGGTETLIGQDTATNGTVTITSNTQLTDGTYDVYAHVVDQAGNASDTNVVNITIVSIDATAPQLTLPGNITEEATSAAGATVTYAASANDAVDGNVTVNCSKNSGATFALGTTTVNCSATDRADNTASGNFDVTVRDTTAPVIAPHGDVTAEATSSSGALVTYASPATSDAVDGAKTANCTPASGGQFPLGDTTITCNATDAAGNQATSTTFKVTVRDTTAPTLDSHDDLSEIATSSSGAVVNYTKPAAHDAVTANPTVTCTPAPGATFPIGTTTVSCTAKDAAGNTSAAKTFKVNVSVSWSGFMQPINTVANMGTAYKQSIFKIGSTVPVKFQLTEASAGITDGNFYLKYIRTGNGDGIGESEVVATSTGNTGTQFRYDATAGQYIFNWSTKGITLAGNYEVRVYTDAAMTNLLGSQSIELKK